MTNQREDHFTLWTIGPQQIQVTCDGGRIVSDAGLLAVRALEKPLRIIAELAQRLPDPRSPKFISHSAEAILTQEVYPILAGYADHNDAQTLRDDPLFQILADLSPDAERRLAWARRWPASPTPTPDARPNCPSKNVRSCWKSAPPNVSASRSSMTTWSNSSSAPAAPHRPKSSSMSMPPMTRSTGGKP